MKMKGFMLALVLLSISGCATTQPGLGKRYWVQPSQAVQLAAAAAPRGVAGTFSLTVKSTGSQNGLVFLDSEFDYRDQRNLSIALTTGTARQLLKRLGLSSVVALKGKHILVHGVARRVKIVFIANGRPTDKYYYQTHVRVSHASQIVLEKEG